ADLIFLFRQHLCKSPVETVGLKNRIVAESGFTARLASDGAIDHPFKIMFVAAQDQTNYRPKAGATRLIFFQFPQEPFDIGPVLVRPVLAGDAGIAGRMDARSAVQAIGFQSAVVGKAIHSVALVNVTGLQGSVFMECGTGFRDVIRATDLPEAERS